MPVIIFVIHSRLHLGTFFSPLETSQTLFNRSDFRLPSLRAIQRRLLHHSLVCRSDDASDFDCLLHFMQGLSGLKGRSGERGASGFVVSHVTRVKREEDKEMQEVVVSTKTNYDFKKLFYLLSITPY